MPRPRPVPLAWRNLTHDRVRFALFTTGIAFAVVLMGVQVGIRNALVESNGRLFRHLDADLVLVHPHRAALFYRDGVPRRRLAQAAGVPGVAAVHPLYLDYQATKFRQAARVRGPGPPPADHPPARSIRVIGLDPAAGLLRDIPELAPGSATAAALRTPGTALFDVKAKAAAGAADGNRRPTVFGLLPAEPGGGWREPAELNRRDLTLVGGFELGTDFAADGTLVVSEETFAGWVRGPAYPLAPMATADLGLVRVARGHDPAAVRDRLRDRLRDPAAADVYDRDVEVLTLDECRDREKQFWLIMTPIGVAFNAGLALGFLVGFVICYQILSGDVADHLGEYATLRAIGYPNRFLAGVVVQQAAFLATAGSVVGLALTAAVYLLIRHSTGLPMDLTPGRAAEVALATAVMCVGSGLLALRKAQTVDPANVF